MKPLTAIIAMVSLIIVGLVIVNNADAYGVSCLCVEGEPCRCENFARPALMMGGFLTIAAGAAIPVLALITASRKGHAAAEVSLLRDAQKHRLDKAINPPLLVITMS